MTTVPELSRRGAFLSANSAVQALGTGCGAWLGGLMLSTTNSGQIEGYGMVGWVAVALAFTAVLWVNRVKVAEQKQPASVKILDAGVEQLNET